MPQKDEARDETISIVLPAEIAKALREKAAREDRTISKQGKRAVEEHLGLREREA